MVVLPCGAGKTIVALLAAVVAMENGFQVAFMAPTEILASQHYATIAPLAEAAGVRLALLTGRDGQRQKKETLRGLADGSIDLVVGTHALLQERVSFARLGLAVIDEQHRFGVGQRGELEAKANGVALPLTVMGSFTRSTTALAGSIARSCVSRATPAMPQATCALCPMTTPIDVGSPMRHAVGRLRPSAMSWSTYSSFFRAGQPA